VTGDQDMVRPGAEDTREVVWVEIHSNPLIITH